MPCLLEHHRANRRRSGAPSEPPAAGCRWCAARILEGALELDLMRLAPDLRLDIACFWTKITVPIATDPTIVILGCWDFDGPRQIPIAGRLLSPQELVYAIAWGDAGPHRIEAICDNRRCTNPYHLRVAEHGQPTCEWLLSYPAGFEQAIEAIEAFNGQATSLLSGANTLAGSNS
jgi:hypothetical protein